MDKIDPLSYLPQLALWLLGSLHERLEDDGLIASEQEILWFNPVAKFLTSLFDHAYDLTLSAHPTLGEDILEYIESPMYSGLSQLSSKYQESGLDLDSRSRYLYTLLTVRTLQRFWTSKDKYLIVDQIRSDLEQSILEVQHYLDTLPADSQAYGRKVQSEVELIVDKLISRIDNFASESRFTKT